MYIRKNANIIMDEIYEDKMLSFFKRWLKSFCNIDCFAVLVILPNNEMLHLSTHPQLTKIYGERKYGLIDQPTNRSIYENYSFYPWRLPQATSKQTEVHNVREKIFNLNCGTNFTRKIHDKQGIFQIIYCVSSYSRDMVNYFHFSANANLILEAGDFAYNSLLDIFQQNCDKYSLPKILDRKVLSQLEIDNATTNYYSIPQISDALKSLKSNQLENETVYKIKNNINLIHSSNTHVKSNRKKPNLKLVI